MAASGGELDTGHAAGALSEPAPWAAGVGARRREAGGDTKSRRWGAPDSAAGLAAGLGDGFATSSSSLDDAPSSTMSSNSSSIASPCPADTRAPKLARAPIKKAEAAAACDDANDACE